MPGVPVSEIVLTRPDYSLTLCSWELNCKFSSLTFFGVNLEFPTVRLHDIVTQRQTQTGSLPGGFCGEEGLKNFIQYILWNAVPIVGNGYVNKPIRFFST